MYVSFCRSRGQIYAPEIWCAVLKTPQPNSNKFDLLIVIKNGSCRRNVYLLHTSIFTFPRSPYVYHFTKDAVTFSGNFRRWKTLLTLKSVIPVCILWLLNNSEKLYYNRGGLGQRQKSPGHSSHFLCVQKLGFMHWVYDGFLSSKSNSFATTSVKYRLAPEASVNSR